MSIVLFLLHSYLLMLKTAGCYSAVCSILCCQMWIKIMAQVLSFDDVSYWEKLLYFYVFRSTVHKHYFLHCMVLWNTISSFSYLFLVLPLYNWKWSTSERWYINFQMHNKADWWKSKQLFTFYIVCNQL